MTVCVQAAGLPDRLRLVETAVMMNSMQNRLALYRTLPTLIGTGIYIISVSQTLPSPPPEHVPSTVDSLTITRGHLDRLWVYGCPLTCGRPVTALCWNTTNPDILAVAYNSSSRGGEPGQGLVCCWSLKNSEVSELRHPESSSVISLSAVPCTSVPCTIRSDFTVFFPPSPQPTGCMSPYSHASILSLTHMTQAGLSNGSVLLFDVRSTQHSAVLDSRCVKNIHKNF